MTLTELRYLVALARERHFGHAAQACNVSQPTLSAAIKKLEEQLGMPLFERRPREVVVTPQAEPTRLGMISYAVFCLKKKKKKKNKKTQPDR